MIGMLILSFWVVGHTILEIINIISKIVTPNSKIVTLSPMTDVDKKAWRFIPVKTCLKEILI